MNILVTDSEYKHSLGIVRSLGKEGFKPYILSFNKNSLCSYSKFSNNELIISEDYNFEQFLDILLSYNIELIILVGTNSFMKIVPWKNKLKIHMIDIITVDENVQNIAFSKKETYSLAEKVGVPIPRTFYPKTLDDIDILKETVSFPCVIKGLYEVGGNIVDYAYTKNDLKEKYINMCNKHSISEKLGLPMLQEYITGVGCAFFAVYQDGKCKLTFQHKRIREYPVSGGSSVCAESYRNDKLEEYGKKLLDSLAWHGVAMVEFKFNSKGQLVLMEINPKFWGSTDLALEAGVNFPKALIDIHNDIEIHYSNNYKFPFRYHWPLQGDILHAIENKKEFLNVVRDILNPNVKSNLWINDILPVFKMLINSLKSIVVTSIQKIKNV